MRMKITVFGFTIATALLCSSAWAQSDPAILAQDQALWKSVGSRTATYQQPPASWQQIHDSTSNLTLAFPCQPRRVEQTIKGRRAIAMSCNDGAERFVAIIGLDAVHDTSAGGRAAIFAGWDHSSLAAIKQVAKAASVPKDRVDYSGFDGRETELDLGDSKVYSRGLVVHQDFCVLSVLVKKNGDASRVEAFFNSLKPA